ncbi:MDR family MFS transporter [Tengunoibacter tsumagoiensis]|uniref:MFS transporter n=1 Tax=Tengunoibacter tsumagoiensis TaxID=2014871 RepID=A0A401ZZ92_9CHLR|nr:MDR family MFS transporter [Tengunoibacter tsumagoiensis]GCE12170.1 MFS transporter [Tengunoibacter tsumagoiensis]
MYHSKINPKVSISIVFVIAMFMSIMDSTIVNTALPSIARDFNITGASVDAIVVSYLVSLAVIIPASGWLGDRFGSRRIFLGALALFTLASALCGLANNLTELVLFRTLQGIAGGALTPVGNAMLIRTFPPAERVQVSRILNIPTVIAPASGPVLGGLLVTSFSWHWVFFVNVPIGIAALIFGILFLHESRESSKSRFDIPGFLLAGIGLALTMYALSEGPNYGWSNPMILGSLIGGLLLLAIFIFVELRIATPMLNLRLMRNGLFRNSNLITVLTSAGFMGVLYATPLFLQEARGVDALTSGLTTFPEALGVITGVQIGSRLYPRIGPRRMIAAGIISASIMMAALVVMGPDTNLWIMRILMFLIGMSMGNIFLPNQAVAFATITASETGQASAIYNTQRQVGSAIGVAIASTVISTIGAIHTTTSGATEPNYFAYHAGFITSAILVLAAIGFALAIRDKDAAATMRQKGKDEPTSEPLELAVTEVSA